MPSTNRGGRQMLSDVVFGSAGALDNSFGSAGSASFLVLDVAGVNTSPGKGGIKCGSFLYHSKWHACARPALLCMCSLGTHRVMERSALKHHRVVERCALQHHQTSQQLTR